MGLKAKLIGVAAAVAVIALSATPTPASAQQSAGIAVSPPTATLTGNRGDTVNRDFLITNVGDSLLEVATEVRNFTAGGASGDQPIFTTEKTGYELASWITMSPATSQLGPGQSATMTAQIKVPKDAPPGGHFGAVTFHPAKLAATGNVKIDQAATSLILFTVPGEIVHNVNVSSFHAQKTSPDAEPKNADVLQKGPVDLAIGLQNSGNVQAVPKFSIEVKDTFGKRVATITDDDPGATLPQSTRTYRQSWTDTPLIGRFTAKVTVTNTGNGQVMTVSTTFWILPMNIILGVVLAFVLVIAMAVFTKKRHSRPKN